MAAITLRSIKGSPLTISEVDTNFTNLNIEVGQKVDITSYTGADILAKLKTVDADNSGLNASTLKSLDVASTNMPNHIVARDTSGNFEANTITVTSVVGNLLGTANNSNSLGGLAAATYAQLNSPTFTGIPVGPTAAPGTSTNQLATTAFVVAASQIQAIFPIGCIYTSTSAANPSTLFGFGTWVAFGAGRVLLGAGGEFAAGTTGGSANAIVVNHSHAAYSSSSSSSSSIVSDPGHTHSGRVATVLGGFQGQGGFEEGRGNPDWSTASIDAASTGISVNTTTSTSTSTSIGSAGSDGTNANLQPYIVVYMWNRIA